MPATSEVFARYITSSRVFVETGTHDGAGVRAALAAGYERVYSIEAATDRYAECKEMFKKDERVYLRLGGSETELGPLLSTIHEPATIWLDAHSAFGAMPPGTDLHPLHAELLALASARVREHTVLVDDVRCFEGMGVAVEQVRELLLLVNPRYTVELIDGNYYKMDVLVASVPR